MKLLFLLILPLFSIAQKKQMAIAGGIYAAAGFLDGQADIIAHNYHLYLLRHPNTNQQFTNPKLSARNKYKDWPTNNDAAFFGSKTFRVGLTDRYHQNRMLRNMLCAGGVGVLLTHGKMNWKQVALSAAISWASYAVGSGLAYKIYNK